MDNRSNSWIVVNRLTGEAVFETWNPNVAPTLEGTAFKAIPAHEYLCALNAKIKAAS